MNKDPKRNFTKAEKDAMLERQNRACPCGRRFTRDRPGPKWDPAWRTGYPPVFHHIEHHKDGGLTALENGVALCRHCHHWGEHGNAQWWCQECRAMAFA
jgi:hypothetical protein